MVRSSAVCGALSFMTTNQMGLSVFPMPCDCWKDLMKAIFWFPATVSEIDDDVKICSEFHIPAPFRLFFSLLILTWKDGGRERERGKEKKIMISETNEISLSIMFFK